MTMPQTLYLFLHDPAFVPRHQGFRPAYDAGGVGRLAAPRLSYFAQRFQVRDPRPANQRTVQWLNTTRPELWIDQAAHPGALGELQALAPAQLQQLFQIVDRVSFAAGAGGDPLLLEGELAASYSSYRAGSLRYPGSNVSDVVYFDDGATQSVSVPPKVEVTVAFTVPGVGERVYALVIWTTDALFRDDYAISRVLQVVPPLPLSQILTSPLTGPGANNFVTALQTGQLAQQTLNPQIAATDSSGYAAFLPKLVDPLGNTLQIPFNLLYQGRPPDRQAMRQAVRHYVLTSGVGTLAQWRARLPELFIEARFYLVPGWANVTTRVDQEVFPSVIPLRELQEQARAVLPHVPGARIEQHGEVLSASYETLLLTAVPHPMNGDVLSLRALHPTYQDFASHEPGFAYLDELTKQFAIKLTRALAVAMGRVEDPLYAPFVEQGAQFVPFEVDETEFCVITQESFLNRLEENA